MNHTIAECCMGTNKCTWCVDPNHSIGICPRRQKAIQKGSCMATSTTTSRSSAR